MPRSPASPNTPLTLSTPTPSLPDHTTTIIVPPNTLINLNIHAAQTNPATFPAPDIWNPKRWIDSPTTTSPSLLESESLISHPLGYLPWSSGPRICPGLKFAQVEFAAVLATVLRGARIEPCGTAGVEGGGPEFLRRELGELVRDSSLEGPTLSLRRGGDVWVRVVGRL